MTQRELLTIAAEAVGARLPRVGIPMALVYAFAHLTDAVGALLRPDIAISGQSAQLIELTSPASHEKATPRELGWYPRPTEEFIARAAQTYVDRRRVISSGAPT
jgi:hypothetical protein